MSDLRSFVTLGILTGIALAILTNADKSVKIVDSVSGAFFNLIKTAWGKDKPMKTNHIVLAVVILAAIYFIKKS